MTLMESDIQASQSPGIWYPGESVFPDLQFEWLREIGTKIEDIWSCWLVAEVGLNYEEEKKQEVENLVGLSL